MFALSTIPDTGAWPSADAVLVQVADEARISELVESTGGWIPWERWAQRQPVIAAAMERATDEPPRPRAEAPPVDAPLDLILAFKWGGVPKRIHRRLVDTADTDDVRLLRSAAVGPWGPARRLALHALGARQDPTALPFAVEILATGQGGGEHIAAFRYVTELRADQVLPAARGWLEPGSNANLFAVGAEVIGLHAERDDLATIQRAFASAWDEQETYTVCSLVAAFGRLPGPHDELALVFDECVYSYGRRLAAEALAATDPTFADGRAVEALWDCEEQTRLIAARTADRSVVAVRERLTRIAADEHQSDELRAAAVAPPDGDG